MELKELKTKTTSELHKLLAESRDALRDLRFKVASKQLKDISSIKKLKKEIANVLTLLNTKKEVKKEEKTEESAK